MSRTRISRFSDPARGGRRVELKVNDRFTTVLHPEGVTEEVHRVTWRDVGTLMDGVENHVKEQPTNRWKQRLIDAQRKAAGVTA